MSVLAGGTKFDRRTFESSTSIEASRLNCSMPRCFDPALFSNHWVLLYSDLVRTWYRYKPYWDGAGGPGPPCSTEGGRWFNRALCKLNKILFDFLSDLTPTPNPPTHWARFNFRVNFFWKIVDLELVNGWALDQKTIEEFAFSDAIS